jgi:hypothetical protein
MNRQEAYRAAAKAAKLHNEIFYVVHAPYEPESYPQERKQGWHIADDCDMDTYFATYEPCAAIMPDGEIC